MKPNREYYEKVDGYWRGSFHLEIHNGKGFLQSSLGRVNKLKLLMAVTSQKIIGKLFAEAHVDFQKDKVYHCSKIKKWGIDLYQGKKNILLDQDGHSLSLSGEESYFPFLRSANFSSKGEIKNTAKEASYQMPLLNIEIELKSKIHSSTEVTLSLENGWIKGGFILQKTTKAHISIV